MPLNCDPRSLAQAVGCLACITDGERLPVLIRLFCRIANMDCDANSLLNQARCFSCIPKGSELAVLNVILCQIANGGGPAPPGDCGGMIWGPDLTTFDHLTLFIDGITTLEFPGLLTVTGTFEIPASDLTSISLPVLATDAGNFNLANLGNLVSVSAPKLVTVAGFFDLQSSTGLTSLNVPMLATVGGYFSLLADPLAAVNLPALTSVGVDCIMGQMPALASISMPVLVSTGQALYFADNPVLASVVFTALQTVGNQVDMHNCPLLPSVDFSNLTAIAGNFIGNGCTILTTVLVPQVMFQDAGITIDFSGCALLAASVNQILARCVASGLTTATIDFTGPNNAAPTGQGIIDKGVLITAGCTVNTN